MARTEVTGKQIKDKSVSLTDDVVGVLPVASGGSGSDSLPLGNVLLGNGTGALQTVAPGTTGNVLTSNGSSWVSSAPTGGGSGDVTTNTSTSVDGEVALFSGTGGKTLKRATGTGYATLSSGVLSAVSSIPQSVITNLATDLAAKESTANKGQANGYPSLDSSGKVPTSQLPVFGAVDSVNGYTGVIVLTKSDVGLGNVDNTSDSAKNVLSATKLTTARNINGVSFDGTASITVADSTKEPTITAGTTAQYWRGDKSWQTLDVAAVPGAEATANKGVANGYASLNASGVIPLTQQTYAVLDGGTSSSAGADVINGGTPVSA